MYSHHLYCDYVPIITNSAQSNRLLVRARELHRYRGRSTKSRTESDATGRGGAMRDDGWVGEKVHQSRLKGRWVTIQEAKGGEELLSESTESLGVCCWGVIWSFLKSRDEGFSSG